MDGTCWTVVLTFFISVKHRASKRFLALTKAHFSDFDQKGAQAVI
jgi:hypothetical protein